MIPEPHADFLARGLFLLHLHDVDIIVREYSIEDR